MITQTIYPPGHVMFALSRFSCHGILQIYCEVARRGDYTSPCQRTSCRVNSYPALLLFFVVSVWGTGCAGEISPISQWQEFGARLLWYCPGARCKRWVKRLKQPQNADREPSERNNIVTPTNIFVSFILKDVGGPKSLFECDIINARFMRNIIRPVRPIWYTYLETWIVEQIHCGI
jgi:hypothetical protein